MIGASAELQHKRDTALGRCVRVNLDKQLAIRLLRRDLARDLALKRLSEILGCPKPPAVKLKLTGALRPPPEIDTSSSAPPVKPSTSASVGISNVATNSSV